MDNFIYDIIGDRIYLIPKHEYENIMCCWQIMADAIERKLSFKETAKLVEDLDYNLYQYLFNIAEDVDLEPEEQIFQISVEYNQETDFANTNLIMLEALPDDFVNKFVRSEKGAWEEIAVIDVDLENEILEYCKQSGYGIEKLPGSIHEMTWPSFMKT
jgi:hypothetical protein